MHRRLRNLAVALAAFALVAVCVVGIASAGSSLAKPKTGAWKFKDASGGFSLVPGKGKKLFVTNIHSRTQNFVGCPEKEEPITVSGRFPLKVITLAGGYKVWGVGKKGEEKRYSDGNTGLISIPAKVRVDGKLVENGAFKMEYSYSDPTEFSALIIEFGPKDRSEPCVTYSQSASHG